MKKLLVIFLLFIFHFSWCFAQDTVFFTGNEKVKNLYYGEININAGIGYGLITWALPNSNVFNFSGDRSYNILSVSPAYNLTTDYNITNIFNIGLCGAYQSLTDNPASDGYTMTWETERISRYNIAIRFLGHLSKNPKHYAYLGARVGMSVWTDKSIAFTPPGPGLVDPWLSMPSYSERGSIQLFFGYRTFLSNNFGLHFEAGIGSPYLVEGGITFRIKTRKNKAG